MNVCKALLAIVVFASANTVYAGPLVNGGFEDGNTNGWTTGGGYRGNTLNQDMVPANFLPGGSDYNGSSNRSSIITAGTVDPIIGAALGSTVHSGSYSYRAEDTESGGYASVISQKVTNYTEANFYFAWKAVLENGGHDADESAVMFITLTDDTTGTLLISRVYNAGDTGGGVDNRFVQAGDYFYTPQWQIEQLAIDIDLMGHDFTISLLAADCNPTAHTGYVYLDGFGERIPDGDVPEPASAGLMALGAVGFLASRRRRKSVQAGA